MRSAPGKPSGRTSAPGSSWASAPGRSRRRRPAPSPARSASTSRRTSPSARSAGCSSPASRAGLRHRGRPRRPRLRLRHARLAHRRQLRRTPTTPARSRSPAASAAPRTRPPPLFPWDLVFRHPAPGGAPMTRSDAIRRAADLLRGHREFDRPARRDPRLHPRRALQAHPGRRACSRPSTACRPPTPRAKSVQIARLERLAEEADLDPEFARKFLNFIISEVIRHHESHLENGPDIDPGPPPTPQGD